MVMFKGALKNESGHAGMRHGARAIASFSVALLIALAVSPMSAQTAGAQSSAATPILIELFTSEGCSSCPPADALVQQLQHTQPVNGAQLIVLSEHVDYWDHDGWKDPYSSSAITDRQIAYVRALGLKEPYTPQLIADGSKELLGSEAQMLQLLQKDAADPAPLSVRLDAVKVDGGNAPEVQGRVNISGAPEKHSGDVYLAVALGHAQSQVLAGENSGKQLTYIDVVQEIRKVGKVDKGGNFAQDFHVKLKPGTDPNNVRLIAFVQEPGPGQVLGATLWKAAE